MNLLDNLWYAISLTEGEVKWILRRFAAPPIDFPSTDVGKDAQGYVMAIIVQLSEHIMIIAMATKRIS